MTIRDWDVAQIEREKRRFMILRHLYSSPGRELSEEILKMACRAVGVPTQDSEIEEAVSWLAERSLVMVQLAGPIRTARLSAHGADVVLGHEVVEGIMPFGDLP